MLVTVIVIHGLLWALYIVISITKSHYGAGIYTVLDG